MPYTGFLLVKHSIDILRRAVERQSTPEDKRLRELACSEDAFRTMNEADRIAHVKTVAQHIMPGQTTDHTSTVRNMFNEYDLYSMLTRTSSAAKVTDYEIATRSPRKFETYMWLAHEYAKRIVSFFDESMDSLVDNRVVSADWRETTLTIANLTDRFGDMHETIRQGGHYQSAMSIIARNAGFTDFYSRTFGGWPDSVGYLVHMAMRLSHMINTWNERNDGSPRVWSGNSLIRHPVVAYDRDSGGVRIKDMNDQGVYPAIGVAHRGSGRYLVRTWACFSQADSEWLVKINIGGVTHVAEHTILGGGMEPRIIDYTLAENTIGDVSGRIYHGANGRPTVRLWLRHSGATNRRVSPYFMPFITELGGEVVVQETVRETHTCASCGTQYTGHRLHQDFLGQDTTLCARCYTDQRALATCERHEWSNLSIDGCDGPDEMGACCPQCMEENEAIRHLAYRRDDVCQITKSKGGVYEIEGEPTDRFLKRLVGVEFETGLISDMMFKVKASKYFKTPGWQVHRDPSLESGPMRGIGADGNEMDGHWMGWEFVTPPVGGTAIEPCVREFYAFRDDVVTPKYMNIENVLAGMHVHADFRDFFDQLEKLCVGPTKNPGKAGELWKSFVLWGKESARIVRQFVSKRRREYCYCNGDLGYRGKHGLKSNLIQFALQNAKIDNVNYPQYSALTLSGRTMEFRIWPSTDNIEYCLARVEITQKLTDFFMKNQETAGETLKHKAKTQTFIQRGLLVGRLTEILGLSPECSAALSALHRRYFFKTFERFDVWTEAKEERQAIADAVNEREIGGTTTVARVDPSSATEYVQRDRGHNHVDLEIQNPELRRVAMNEEGIRVNGIDDESQVTLLDTMVALPSGYVSRGERTDRAMRYVKDDGRLERVSCGYRVQA